jgi:hypothetical protein
MDLLLANRRPPFVWGLNCVRTEVPEWPDTPRNGPHYWHGHGTDGRPLAALVGNMVEKARTIADPLPPLSRA